MGRMPLHLHKHSWVVGSACIDLLYRFFSEFAVSVTSVPRRLPAMTRLLTLSTDPGMRGYPLCGGLRRAMTATGTQTIL